MSEQVITDEVWDDLYKSMERAEKVFAYLDAERLKIRDTLRTAATKLKSRECSQSEKDDEVRKVAKCISTYFLIFGSVQIPEEEV